MSQGVKDTIRSDLDNRFLTFFLDHAIYGVELTHVLEIILMQPITPVPGVPPYLKGVINLRGKIIPVISVRSKFHQTEAEYTDRTCIIVVAMEDKQVGLIVDSISDVVTISDENLAVPPEYGTVAKEKYLAALSQIGGNMIHIISCDKFFASDLIEDNPTQI